MQTFSDVEAIVKFSCMKRHRLNCSIFKASVFEDLIKAGHIYYVVAGNEKNLIYDDGYYGLPEFNLDAYEETRDKVVDIFNTGLAKAKNFYDLAEVNRSVDLHMSAFLLNQSTDICLNTLVKALTGQKKNGHSIHLMLKYAAALNSNIPLSPQEDIKEDSLMIQLMERANACYRYTNGFRIGEQELQQLFVMVEMLHDYALLTYRKWITEFDLLSLTAHRHG